MPTEPVISALLRRVAVRAECRTIESGRRDRTGGRVIGELLKAYWQPPANSGEGTVQAAVSLSLNRRPSLSRAPMAADFSR
jgi:hypothetical protein